MKLTRYPEMPSLVAVLIAGLSAILIVLLLDILLGTWLPLPNAVVVDRVYQPRSTTYGTGTVVAANGQVQTITTVNTEPEKWTVILDAGGAVGSASADPFVWAACEKGCRVQAQWMRGGLTGLSYTWRVVSVNNE